MLVPLFRRGNASDIQVMVGNSELSKDSPSQIVDVKSIFVHEEYASGARNNDIAVLKVRL
jgi:secreted trypsin-like serine protease